MEEGHPESRWAAILYVDMMSHMEAFAALSREQQQEVMTTFRSVVERLCTKYPAFYLNFTGDGYLILFEEPSDAALFSLMLTRRWRGELETSAKLPQDFKIGLTSCLHAGRASSLAGSGDRIEYFGESLGFARRLMELCPADSLVASEAAMDALDLSMFRWEVLGDEAGLRDDPLGGKRRVFLVKEYRGLKEMPESGGPRDLEMAQRLFRDALSFVGTEREYSQAALKMYELAFEFGLEHYGARYNYAKILKRQGMLEESEVEVRRALALKPQLADAHNLLALILEEKGEPVEAEEHFRRALELENAARFRNNLGFHLMQQGRLTEAEIEIRRALEMEPEFAPALHSLGCILFRERQMLEAEKYLLRAIAAREDEPEYHRDYARLLMESGRNDDATRQLKRALELAPGDTWASDSIVELTEAEEES